MNKETFNWLKADLSAYGPECYERASVRDLSLKCECKDSKGDNCLEKPTKVINIVGRQLFLCEGCYENYKCIEHNGANPS